MLGVDDLILWGSRLKIYVVLVLVYPLNFIETAEAVNHFTKNVTFSR